MMGLIAGSAKWLMLVLRRILPPPLFKTLMRFGIKHASRILPSGSLEQLEQGARNALRSPAPAGGFYPGVKRKSICQPGNGAVGFNSESFELGDSRSGRTLPPPAMVLCCAFSGRHEILEEIIHETFSARHGEQVRWMLAGSSEEDLAFIKKMAVKTSRVAGFVCANRPLGRKWQSCAYYAHHVFNGELTGITGSDDLVSGKLIDHLIERHRHNLSHGLEDSYMPALYGTMQWLVVDLDAGSNWTGGIFKCGYRAGEHFQPLGAGRFYTASFMNEVDGFLFDSRASRLLDDRGFYEVQTRGLPMEYFGIDDGLLISVKGGWAKMNALSAMLSVKSLWVEEFSFRGSALIQHNLSKRASDYLRVTASGESSS